MYRHFVNHHYYTNIVKPPLVKKVDFRELRKIFVVKHDRNK